MPDDNTARHALPNLYVGQAQKEITHNEALARIDALLHPVVEDSSTAPIEGLTVNSDGLCWLISNASTGLWSGRSGQIARWSGGSWRYLSPVAGMTIWNASGNKRLFYIDNAWVEPAAIVNPDGGTTIDAQARTVINAVLAHLRLISSLPM